MKQHGECTIREMRAADLDLVLSWRNDPSIRASMLSQHEISLDEHARWFERASAERSRRLLLVEDGGVPFGFVQFSGVAPGGIADWGFYVAPSSPKGSGQRLGRAALNLAFGELQIHKVCGQALGSNGASIRFHEAAGFRNEGLLREHRLVDGKYHDLVLFGMLKQDWSRLKVEQ